MKLLEAHIERAIVDLLELDDWVCRKMEQNFSERKRKIVGEAGMPDRLCIRYLDKARIEFPTASGSLVVAVLKPPAAEVMWLELKSLKGKHAPHQKAWQAAEMARGALVLRAGIDFEASIEGFAKFYAASGLQRRKFHLGSMTKTGLVKAMEGLR